MGGVSLRKANITKLAVQDIVLLIREWSEETQREFAKDIGKSYSSITKIETGERNMYLHTFLDWGQKKGIKVIIEKDK